MDSFCLSCGASLSTPEFKGPAKDYCKYCTDEAGKLKPREAVKAGVAQWFKTWQPNIDDATALERAEYFLRSMPAWAE